MKCIALPSDSLSDLSPTAVGTIGEKLVNAYLLKQGYDCHPTDYGSFDLIMYGKDLPNGEIIRIDVKTNRGNTGNQAKYAIGKSKKYGATMAGVDRDCAVDLFAFVNLQSNTIHFKHYSELLGVSVYAPSNKLKYDTKQTLTDSIVFVCEERKAQRNIY